MSSRVWSRNAVDCGWNQLHVAARKGDLKEANTYDELPEQVIGAARLAHVEPSAAVVPDLDNNSDNSSKDNSNNNTSSEDVLSKKTN